MKIKQTIILLAIIAATVIITSPSVYSIAVNDGSSGGTPTTTTTAPNRCAGVDTSIISCAEPDPNKTDIDGTGLWSLLIMALNILTAGVGVAAVGGIVYGGILYSTSQGKPEQRKKSITTIFNVIVGLVLFALMSAFLNYLIPGGILN